MMTWEGCGAKQSLRKVPEGTVKNYTNVAIATFAAKILFIYLFITHLRCQSVNKY